MSPTQSSASIFCPKPFFPRFFFFARVVQGGDGSRHGLWIPYIFESVDSIEVDFFDFSSSFHSNCWSMTNQLALSIVGIHDLVILAETIGWSLPSHDCKSECGPHPNGGSKRIPSQMATIPRSQANDQRIRSLSKC